MFTKSNLRTLYLFAFALMIASSANITSAAEEQMEKCYGVSKAGENDGIADKECEAGPDTRCKGASPMNYQGNEWKWVKKGTCIKIHTPMGMGSLKDLWVR